MGYMQTPRQIILRQRLRLIAQSRVEYAQAKKQQEQQEEAEREADRAKRRT